MSATKNHPDFQATMAAHASHRFIGYTAFDAQYGAIKIAARLRLMAAHQKTDANFYKEMAADWAKLERPADQSNNLQMMAACESAAAEYLYAARAIEAEFNSGRPVDPAPQTEPLATAVDDGFPF